MKKPISCFIQEDPKGFKCSYNNRFPCGIFCKDSHDVQQQVSSWTHCECISGNSTSLQNPLFENIAIFTQSAETTAPRTSESAVGVYCCQCMNAETFEVTVYQGLNPYHESGHDFLQVKWPPQHLQLKHLLTQQHQVYPFLVKQKNFT